MEGKRERTGDLAVDTLESVSMSVSKNKRLVKDTVKDGHRERLSDIV